MRNFVITVNGKTYQVGVEEVGASAPVVAPVAPVVAAPVAAAPVVSAAPKAAPAPAKASSSAGAGSVRIEAGAAGKVFKIVANVGTAVKAGDAVIIIEAMKMEIPVVAPKDGTVASIDCAIDDPCAAGQLLATLN